MKVLLSWIRELVDIDEPAEAIGRRLSHRGLALEGLEACTVARPPSVEGQGPLEDALFDFDVTANRPDCMSVAGIAREIAVAFGRPYRERSTRASASAEASADRRRPGEGGCHGREAGRHHERHHRADDGDLAEAHPDQLGDVDEGDECHDDFGRHHDRAALPPVTPQNCRRGRRVAADDGRQPHKVDPRAAARNAAGEKHDGIAGEGQPPARQRGRQR